MGDLETKLIEWSTKRELWQQDLLRRLAMGEVLGADDHDAYAKEIERLSLAEPAQWITTPVTAPTEQVFEPLGPEHLQSSSADLPPVTIDKVTHIEGANDLSKGAEVSFAKTGLTIVAGNNGSGKSGYTRILKQVAATRGPEIVLANAFGDGTTPKAVISYSQGKTTAIDLTWQADKRMDVSPLQRVRVFDARSAAVHIASSNEIAYVPPVLQIISEYTTALRAIDAIIQSDLQNDRNQVATWYELESGALLEIFGNLGAQKSKSAIAKLAQMSKEELDELAKLPAKIQELSASDPAKLTVQARSRASQLATLSRNLEVISTALSADQLALVTAARERITKADAAVKAASTLLDGDNVMEGVGTERWRDLWLAAEAFVHTEEDHDYHDLSEEAVCVLCQQPLADDAKLRFKRFEDFMKGEARTELTRAQDALNSLLEGLRGLPFGTLVTQDLVDLVGTYDDPAAKLLLPTCAEALALRDNVLANEPAPKSDAEGSLKERFTQLRTAIDKASAEETAIADKTADVDSNTIAANKLKLRLDELELRRKLTARRAEVSRDHDRHIRIERLEKASKKCDTTAASRQSTSLAKEYVDKVCAAFAIEAKGLGLDRVPVELVFDRTTLGVSFIKVALVDAPNISVATVLSEGEQRVTAVAGFFADLTESGDESTLVFDDPVSSLDQDFREHVAKRLLLEAGKRQVLVFSHDFTFVQYLYEQKRYLDDELAAGARTEPVAAVEYVHITRTSSGTGVPTTAEQWRTVPIAERIKRLNERIQNARVLYKSKDDVAYAKEAKDIVSSIRETWEYFVEQVLLEGVVRRHERSVATMKLRYLVDLTDADIATVNAGMTVTSRYMTGHSSPTSDGTQMQSPDWIADELGKLTALRDAIIQRRKKK